MRTLQRRDDVGTRFLTVDEVARLLNLGTKSTWAFLKEREIPYRRIQHDRRFPLSVVLRAFYEGAEL